MSVQVTTLIAAATSRDNIKTPYTELLKFDCSEFQEPYFFANDLDGLTFDGDDYIGYPFSLQLLSDQDRIPEARLVIQNVDRRIGQAVNAVNRVIRVTLSVIIQGVSSKVLVWRAEDQILQNVTGSAQSIEGSIRSYFDEQEPFPFLRVTKNRFPGLYV